MRNVVAMRNIVAIALTAMLTNTAWAKIPAPVLDDAAKAKAEEAKAKTAWAGKVDAYQLCKSQDRVVAHVNKAAKSAPAAPTTPSTCADPGPFVSPNDPAPAPAPAVADAKAAKATKDAKDAKSSKADKATKDAKKS